MDVWKIIFLSKSVICRFHVNLPGCKDHQNEDTNDIARLHVFFYLAGPVNLFFRCVLTILFLAGMVNCCWDFISHIPLHKKMNPTFTCNKKCVHTGDLWPEERGLRCGLLVEV